jgi:hypothetical protein
MRRDAGQEGCGTEGCGTDEITPIERAHLNPSPRKSDVELSESGVRLPRAAFATQIPSDSPAQNNGSYFVCLNA